MTGFIPINERGFGPPDLNLPTGKCKKGHPWLGNLAHNSQGNRICLTCRRAYNKKVYDRKRAEVLRVKAKQKVGF